MTRRYTKIDVALASALYAEHKNCRKVADIIGANRSGVLLALKRAGVTVRTHNEALIELHADPEFKAAAAARMKARHADPEFKAANAARAAARLKRMWAAAKAAGA